MISETFNKTIVFIKGGIQVYKKTIEEVVNSLDTNIEKGLTSSEAKKRQDIYGTNELEKPQKRSLLLRFLDQFKDAMIIILIIAAIISAVVAKTQGTGEYIDSIIIITIVVLNAIMGVVQEAKAEKSLEALKKMSALWQKKKTNEKIFKDNDNSQYKYNNPDHNRMYEKIIQQRKRQERSATDQDRS